MYAENMEMMGRTMPREIEIQPEWDFFNRSEETIAEAVIHQAVHIALAPMRDAVGACHDEIRVICKETLSPEAWQRFWKAFSILDNLIVLNINAVEKVTLAAVRAMPNRTDLTMDAMLAQVRHAMRTETPEQIVAQRGQWYRMNDEKIEAYLMAERARWNRKRAEVSTKESGASDAV